MPPSELPTPGATVRHPLYPELGTGTVEHVSDARIASQVSARIRWTTGQVSTHNLAVLVECEPTPLATPTPLDNPWVPEPWHPREDCADLGSCEYHAIT